MVLSGKLLTPGPNSINTIWPHDFVHQPRSKWMKAVSEVPLTTSHFVQDENVEFCFGKLTVRSIYHTLLSAKLKENLSSPNLSKIWQNCANSQLKLRWTTLSKLRSLSPRLLQIRWKINHGKLPIGFQNADGSPRVCPLCLQKEQDFNHLYSTCSYGYQIYLWMYNFWLDLTAESITFLEWQHDWVDCKLNHGELVNLLFTLTKLLLWNTYAKAAFSEEPEDPIPPYTLPNLILAELKSLTAGLIQQGPSFKKSLTLDGLLSTDLTLA